jgi:hypothetical protein
MIEQFTKNIKKTFHNNVSDSTREKVVKIVNLPSQIKDEVKIRIDQYEQERKQKSFLKKDTYEQKLTNGEMLHMPHVFSLLQRMSREDRKERIVDIKESINWLRIECAKREDGLIKKIFQNESLTSEQINTLIHETFDDLPVTENQLQVIENISEKFLTRNEKVKELRVQFPVDTDLFRELIGCEPVGEVEILDTPVGFYIRTQNKIDYTKVYHLGEVSSWSSVDISASDFKASFKGLYQKAQKSLGVQIHASLHDDLQGGGITAENANHSFLLGRSKDTFIHETQHAVHKFFKQELDASLIEDGLWDKMTGISIADKQEIESTLSNIFRQRRRDIEERAKDEIFAQIKSGLISPEVLQTIMLTGEEHGGGYDYVSDSLLTLSYTPDSFSTFSHPDLLNREYARFDSTVSIEETNKIKYENDKYRNDMYRIKEEQKEKVNYINQIRGSIFRKVYREEYAQIINNAIDVLKEFDQNDIPRNVAIRLLTHEPLRNWKKIARRLFENIDLSNSR